MRETLLAVLVVALTFLNFGHVSVSASGDFRVTPDSWCGSPLLPDSPDHSPCHACRIGGGADLPPPASVVEPVLFIVAPVAYANLAAVAVAGAHVQSAFARGPPPLI